MSACGCELLNHNGQPATWADKGLTLAQAEIKDNGWINEGEALKTECSLVDYFKVGPPTMQDDEMSLVHSMDILSPYVQAPNFSELHTSSTQAFKPDRCYSSAEISAVISEDGHTGCSPRAISMLASGSEEFRGNTQYIVIEDAEQCILKYRGKRMGLFPQYLKALVRAIPRAAMKIMDWNIFNTIQMNGWNTVETGDKALTYQIGAMPSIPDAVLGMATLRDFERHLRMNDFPGKKVWHIDERVFRSMMLFRQFNGAAGFQVQANSFMGPSIPSYSVGEEVSIDGLSFKICDLPFGYIKQTGPSARQFIPVDPRVWKAVNRGVRAFGDSRYNNPTFTDDAGVTHKLISPAWAADRNAYERRAFGFDASTPVTSGADAWKIASTVQFVGGADLKCNVDRTKFQPRYKSAWKMDPQMPRAVGIGWSQLPGEERIANRIGLDSYALVPALPVTVNPGCAVNGLTCAEAAACAEPLADLPAVVGTFKTECEVVVAAGSLLLKVYVNRIVPVGSAASGAASLAYATANGTATSGAGNEYTAESGTLNWADGECGLKMIDIVLLSTATPGTQFNINYSSATGATLPVTSCTTTVVKFPAAE